LALNANKPKIPETLWNIRRTPKVCGLILQLVKSKAQERVADYIVRLVDRRRLANVIYGYNLELKDDGIFLFMAMANPDVKVEELERAIHKEIDRVKSGDVTKEELERVKINTKADFIFSLENSSKVNLSIWELTFPRGPIYPPF